MLYLPLGPTIKTKELLAISEIETTKYGYISRAKADEDNILSTSDIIKEKVRKGIHIPEDYNWELVEKAIEHYQSIQLDSAKDSLEVNLILIANSEYLSEKRIGIAAYLVQGYKNYLSYVERQSNKVVSQHIGQIKDKIQLEIKIVGENTFQTQFGYTDMYIMKDNNGNELVWFSSNRIYEFEIGKSFIIKGTVKEHKVYKEKNQTVLTRCKIIEEIK